jgi:hypothetical protein
MQSFFCCCMLAHLSLRFLLFDYTPWTITNSESAVAWRSAFGWRILANPNTVAPCARCMLGNSATISNFFIDGITVRL